MLHVTIFQLPTASPNPKDGPFSLVVTKGDKIAHLPVQYKSRKKARRVARNVRRALDA